MPDSSSPQSKPVNTRISVIIPARDEAVAIGDIILKVNKALASLDYEVILVDDGSRDETRRIAISHGAVVVSHPLNLGKGAAMKTGVEISTGSVIVFMDGDGQHRPSEIPKVIKPILDKTAEMVIGSRTLRESQVTIVPFTRKLSNFLASIMISFMISFLLPIRTLFRAPLKWINITDCTSGFRAITKERWQQLKLTSNGFEIETEMIYEAARNRVSIKEAPISCTWASRISHLYVLKDGLKTFKLLFKKLVQRSN